MTRIHSKNWRRLTKIVYELESPFLGIENDRDNVIFVVLHDVLTAIFDIVTGQFDYMLFEWNIDPSILNVAKRISTEFFPFNWIVYMFGVVWYTNAS